MTIRVCVTIRGGSTVSSGLKALHVFKDLSETAKSWLSRSCSIFKIADLRLLFCEIFLCKTVFFYFYQSFIMREGKCIRRTSLLTAVIEDGYHSNFLINPNAVGFEIFNDISFIIQNSFSISDSLYCIWLCWRTLMTDFIIFHNPNFNLPKWTFKNFRRKKLNLKTWDW